MICFEIPPGKSTRRSQVAPRRSSPASSCSSVLRPEPLCELWSAADRGQGAWAECSPHRRKKILGKKMEEMQMKPGSISEGLLKPSAPAPEMMCAPLCEESRFASLSDQHGSFQFCPFNWALQRLKADHRPPWSHSPQAGLRDKCMQVTPSTGGGPSVCLHPRTYSSQRAQGAGAARNGQCAF